MELLELEEKAVEEVEISAYFLIKMVTHLLVDFFKPLIKASS